MIRKPVFQLLNSVYEVFENSDDGEPVGKATVWNGIIETLSLQSDANQAYKGQILFKLLKAIAEDGDKYNSNTSIQIADPHALRMIRFLERFGYRKTNPGIFKRTAGSSIPPSVMW